MGVVTPRSVFLRAQKKILFGHSSPISKERGGGVIRWGHDPQDEFPRLSSRAVLKKK